MAQRRDPDAQARSFAERYPDNTPVWYYPIMGDTATRRATWIRGEPWIVGNGEVVVKVKDATGCVSIDHIEFRKLPVATNDTPEVEPAGPTQRLAVYAYSASISCPQHHARWDGTIERPRIASHADYIEARKEIARDGNVGDHGSIQIQHLSLVGYTRNTKRPEMPIFRPIANVELRTPQEVQDMWIDRVKSAGFVVEPAAAKGGEA